MTGPGVTYRDVIYDLIDYDAAFSMFKVCGFDFAFIKNDDGSDELTVPREIWDLIRFHGGCALPVNDIFEDRDKYEIIGPSGEGFFLTREIMKIILIKREMVEA